MYKYVLYLLGLLNLAQINILNPLSQQNSLIYNSKCITQKNIYGSLAHVNSCNAEYPYLSMEFYEMPTWANGTIVITYDEKSPSSMLLSNNANASFIINSYNTGKNNTSYQSVTLMGKFSKISNNDNRQYWILKIENIRYSDNNFSNQEVSVDKYLNYNC